MRGSELNCRMLKISLARPFGSDQDKTLLTNLLETRVTFYEVYKIPSKGAVGYPDKLIERAIWMLKKYYAGFRYTEDLSLCCHTDKPATGPDVGFLVLTRIYCWLVLTCNYKTSLISVFSLTVACYFRAPPYIAAGKMYAGNQTNISVQIHIYTAAGNFAPSRG